MYVCHLGFGFVRSVRLHSPAKGKGSDLEAFSDFDLLFEGL